MTQSMKGHQTILELVQNLTPQQEQEVLDFIEFLQFKAKKLPRKKKKTFLLMNQQTLLLAV